MKVLLAGLNAKYIHSSLALYALAANCRKNGQSVEIAEYTINQEFLHVLGDIADRRPEVLGLACYIWNRELTLNLAAELKKILPEVCIVLGGPEVSPEAEKVLIECSSVNFVIQGEGEESFSELLVQLSEGVKSVSVAGVALRSGDRIELNGGARVVEDLDCLPFPYQTEQLEGLRNRIVYYESSRGCPFACSYCVSGSTSGVRTRNLKQVKSDLEFFLRHTVTQVKFVDRTFNVKPEHYREIWRFLREAGGETGFHFEIVADLLSEEDVQWLVSVPPRLFQFEIGVQSTGESTLAAIGRQNQWDRLARNVRNLAQSGNIHLHLDLIAGLPQEDLAGFSRSFNATYDLKPDMLQLGFLKLLPGARLRAEAAKYGYVCLSRPPYEILANHELSYKEIRSLKVLEEVFNHTYNSGRFIHTISYLIQVAACGDAFAFFARLSAWWKKNRLTGVSHSPDKVLGYFLDFSRELAPLQQSWVAELLKVDVLMDASRALKGEQLPWNREKWAESKNDFWRSESKMRQYIPDYVFTNWRDVKRRFPIEVFCLPVQGWIAAGTAGEAAQTSVLFDLESQRRSRYVLPETDFATGDGL